MAFSTNRDGTPSARDSWAFLRHWALLLSFVSMMLSGCKGPVQPDQDIRGKLLDILAHVGSESPQIGQLHENHDIVPILIDIAKDKDVSWYRALSKRPRYEETADDETIRRGIWDTVFGIFDRFADERGYRFQVQAYQDLSEPYIIRMNALRRLTRAAGRV